MPDVIILNKIFNGTRWTQDPKNIPHEIIDFLMPDGGNPDEGYVFLVPDGAGPDQKKTAKLLVLTTNKITHGGYNILAVIELRDRLHYVRSVKKGKNGPAAFDSRRKKNLEDYKRNAPNITFGDKKLDDLFGPGIHVTYEAGKIYRPTEPIEISSDFYPEGQHTKSVLDEGTPNFEFINNLVSNLDTNPRFEPFERQTLTNEENSLREMTEKLREAFYGETGRGRTSSINDDDSENKGEKPVMNNQDNKLLPRNLIYFGAPGTGKSFKLKQGVENVFVDKNGEITTNRYERVTFYPTYSYAQFVGCYKPVMNGSDIAYEFVPGPFLRVLVNALSEKPGNDGKRKDWCLVIEEINRANAAAVFGDVFQLLDRGSDGVSEYDVAASEDIKRFLQEEFKDCSPSKDDDSEESKNRNPLSFLKVAFKKDGKGNDTKEWASCRLRIPSNMCIWATMNSADQGVFPMDTAFKRRWEFEYIDIDNGSADCERWSIDGKYGYKWDAVRRLLNGLLSLHRVNEDKLMGAHFVKPEKDTDTVSEKSFKSKVLMYLWEDAARMCRRQMFGDIGTYSALLNAWDENGVGIFSNDPELGKLTDAADTKKIFAELSKIAPRAESTQPKPSEQTQPDDEPTSEPAP